MTNYRLLVLVLTTGVCLQACFAAGEDKPAVVRLTNQVLVEDCSRFGINLGGDSYYSGSVLRKKRVVENFEGSTYRQAHSGPVWDERGATTWFSLPEQWRNIFIGSRFVILSGAGQWSSGRLLDIIQVPYEHEGTTVMRDMFKFDRPIPPVRGGGVMLEAERLDEGYIGPHDQYWRKNLSPEVGDAPPGSFGRVACRMNASKDDATIRFSTHYHRFGELNGAWKVHFWAKAVSGKPDLKVMPDRGEWGQFALIHPGPKWQKHELRLLVDGVPETIPAGQDMHLLWLIQANGGEVLIDDVEIWREGDENPTDFRDDLVSTLRKYKPGILRNLQMGGNTLRNTLSPPLEAHAFTSSLSHRPGPSNSKNRASYGLHQFYELCRYIGAEPWYSLPGTMSQEEMLQFMEYLGGDINTEFGRLRIAKGQKEPWTEVLPRIHIEFGNEAWNTAPHYKAGGFNGPDYWRNLISTAKDSPYYRKNIVFHIGGQAGSPNRNKQIVADTPNADRLSVAPYLVHTLNREDMDLLDSDDDFFRWAFAWSIRQSLEKTGSMFRNHEVAQKNGLDLSIYEINHHTTGGDAPLEPRNKLVTSLGGGLNVINSMLLMLREQHAREQCFFSLAQRGYQAKGIGEVRLWGAVLSMRAGHERYRPTFLSVAAANQVIAGNMVKTEIEGAPPAFEATGVFSKWGVIQTVKNIPSLWTYGFADGRFRGLIVINLDTRASRDLVIKYPGNPAGPANTWLLTADRIRANNEFEEKEPQVTLRGSNINNFASGTRLSIPPHSMLTLRWELQ